MKKAQSLIAEYVLLILLSISVLAYTILWFNQNKVIFSDFLTENQIEDVIQVIDNFIYNFDGMKYARQTVTLEGVKGLCIGNYTIIQTKYSCKTSPKTVPFQGYVIKVNESLYIYSNKTKVYYSMVPVGFYVYRSCYEGFTSYIINSTRCRFACVGKCDILLIKNGSAIEIR